MSQWQFVVTPLTPLYIGAGEQIEPFEYVIHEGRVYKFAPEDLLARLTVAEQDEFLAHIETNLIAARQFIAARAPRAAQIAEYSFAVTPQVADLYEKRMGNPQSDGGIGVFIRTNRRPYLPGSSLKGALRTALLYANADKPIKSKDARELEEATFGYRNAMNDPFRLLKIGDSAPFAETRLAQVNVHTFRDEWSDGKIPLLREVTVDALTKPEGAAVTLTVSVDDETKYKTPPAWLTMPNLIQACRMFYREHLEHEATFHQKLDPAREAYAELKKRDAAIQADAPHAFLVRLGWGSGFDAMTVRYGREGARPISEVRPPKKKKNERDRRENELTRDELALITPASRHLDENGFPLGWVEVEVVPLDEAAKQILSVAAREPVRVQIQRAETARVEKPRAPEPTKPVPPRKEATLADLRAKFVKPKTRAPEEKTTRKAGEKKRREQEEVMRRLREGQ